MSDTPDFKTHRILGRTGLKVSRIGLAGGYRIPAPSVERAYHEFGINYFYWSARRPGMKDALKHLARTERDNMVITIQSYDHAGFWLENSVKMALKQLGTDYADILFMGWFQNIPRDRVMETAEKLKEQGLIRHLGVTGHERKFHGKMARDPDGPFDVLQVRYNAAHRGAEHEVFSDLPDTRPGITTYTATRWGKLLQADKMPNGEKPLTAAECYRFALSHPEVDLCLAGPKTEQEMLEGLSALEQGPLDETEMARIIKIGNHVHG